MPTGILFLIVLIIVVVVHEAGHFFAAKQVGMRVKEFAFGFPPKLFSKTKGETTYSFNAIPLGGYVSIDGENGTNDPSDPRLFTNKSKWAQAWVLFAGPFMNIVLAFVLMSLSFMIGYGGNDTGNSLVVIETAVDSPAFVSGLKAGDKIASVYKTGDIDPSYNPDTNMFKSVINSSNGQEVIIEVKRSKELETIYVTPEKINDEYKIGVSLGVLESKKLGFFAAIAEGFKSTIKMTAGTVQGFTGLISSLFQGESVKGALTGPIGIAKQVGTASGFGFAYLLSFISLISINLGVLNMFPFPALDGGRLLFLVIEKIKGSRINANTAGIINTIGFGLLMLLMVVITIKDIIKLF